MLSCKFIPGDSISIILPLHFCCSYFYVKILSIVIGPFSISFLISSNSKNSLETQSFESYSGCIY